MQQSFSVKPIAYTRSDFKEKFGIPRQSGRAPSLTAELVFLPEYACEEAFRGIEGFSHLWLIFDFSLAHREEFSPTVRPPRLGGNERVGVFASRSPFRPNPIGLTSVKLLRVEETTDNGLVLVVSGADLLDGTPIYDIKPYLAFSDSHPQAKSGFAEATQNYRLQVQIAADLLQRISHQACPWEALKEILSQDPRPAYQHDPDRVYHLDYDDWKVDFTVDNATVCIKNISKKHPV